MSAVSRREFFRQSGLGLAICGFSATVHGAEPQPRNVLFLMTDQHRYDILGCMGNPVVKTPNLDRLAKAGVRFTRATCVVPYCSPTRAAFMTGRYPSTIGYFRNVSNKPDDPMRMREPAVPTFMHVLARQGYQCHHLGKWHLGHQKDLACFADGIGDVERPKAMLQARRRAAGEGVYAAGPRAGETQVGEVFMTANTARCHRIWKDDKRRTQQDLSIIGRSRVKPEYQYESVLADYCVELLRKHRDKPFAITYSVSPPHALWVAPAPFYDLYDPAVMPLSENGDAPVPEAWRDTQACRLAELFGPAGMREYLRCYYAQVSMMDWCFGRILDELQRLGLAHRTLIVFTSDHGDMLSGHGLMDKTVPNFYEEILRVPLLMRLPGKIPAGSTNDRLNSSVDIPVTILDYLQAPPLPGAHGHSLRPVIDGRHDARRAVFAERGNWRRRNVARMVRTERWKLSLFGDGTRQLFDLKSDPDERRDLAGSPAVKGTIEELSALLKTHMTDVGDPALTKFFPETPA